MKTNATQKLSPAYAWLIVILGSLYYAYQFLLRVEPSVMVPQLMRAFHIGATEVGLLSALYYYAYTPLQVLVGTILDTYGTRRVLTLAALACAAGSLLFNTTMPMHLAQIGRFLTGFGSAFAFVGAMKLTSDWLPNKWFAFVAGLTTTLGMIGAIAGETFLTRMIDGESIQHVVWLTAGLGLLFAFLLFVLIRDRKNPEFDAEKPNAWRTMFGHIWSVLKNPQVWMIGFVGGALFMPNSVFSVLWGIPYLQTAHHMTHTDAAFTSTMVFYGWGVGSPFAGWLSTRLRCRYLLMLGSLLSSITALCIFYIPMHAHWELNLLLFLLGLFCSVEILVFAMARSFFLKNLTGTAVSVTNMLTMSVGAFLQPLVGWLLDVLHGKPTLVDGVRTYTATDFNQAFSIIPIVLLLAIFFAWKIDPSCDTLSVSDDDEA